MKAFPSISAQILIAVLITVVSVLGVSSIIELNILNDRETQMLHDRGALTADRLANSLAYPLWNLSPEQTERVVLDEISSPDVASIRVFDENGDLYVGKIRGTDGVIRNIEAPNAAGAGVPLNATTPSAAPACLMVASQVVSMNWNSPRADDVEAPACGLSPDSTCAVAKR